ncbi:MAG: MarR family transcriptional regulator [Aeromicrobium sp.]
MVNREAPQVGFMVKQAQSLLRARMEDELRPLGLTVPQFACLNLLQLDPGASASELARAAFVSRQSMNPLLQSLMDRGLVGRPAKPASGRARPAALTPEGGDLVVAARQRVAGVEQQMLSGLSADATSALRQGLASCIAALGGDHVDHA